ncbi:MAG: DNA repair protein RecO [Candidatus Hydrogenedentes bacterium]|nr:DNA repair protein RecO [Candidatus Hydrogenedentota bacterium]
MSQERSEAIVIRGVDFSETSRIVTFLTPERGKLACMATGVRRAKSPLAAALDTFNRVEIVYYWKEGRSVQKLGEATLLDAFTALKSDVEKSVYAAFPLEFALRVAQEDEPSHALYRVLADGLRDLAAWQGTAKAHVSWIVYWMLAASGFEPNLEPSSSSGPIRFSYDSGVVDSGMPADRTLSMEELESLQAIAASPGACPANGLDSRVFESIRRYAARQVDCEFRSLRVIEQMFG